MLKKIKQHIKIFKNSKGFSIIGVLVSISMGLLVLLGLSSMLSNINTDVVELKKKANRIDLSNQISSLISNDCKSVLLKSLSDLNNLNKGGGGTSNTDPITFVGLKDGMGNEVLNMDMTDADNKKKIKRLYGIEGHSGFQLKCEEISSSSPPSSFFEYPKPIKVAKNRSFFWTRPAWATPPPSSTPPPSNNSGCDCSSGNTGDYPCNKNWSLSLFTMSYKNNLPVYEEVLKLGLKIIYKSNTLDNFTCNFTSSPITATSPSGVTFFGQEASQTGTNNSFFGNSSGRNNTSGNNNSFFGSLAGLANTEGSNNSCFGISSCGATESFFIGSIANRKYITGDNNSLFGSAAGYWLNGNTTNNSFFGYNAGRVNRKIGYGNSLFGSNLQVFELLKGSAKQVINGHSAFGYDSCYDSSSVSQNTLAESSSRRHFQLSSSANGDYVVCIANLIKGKGSDIDNGAPNGVNYPSGGIDIHGKLEDCRGGHQSCKEPETKTGSSSREYKKNIVPFNEEGKALEALLKTPLFYFQYKEEHPEKQRMGIISEELPKSLQLPKKRDKPIQPDWISIYGYLWAGIKALHKELVHLKQGWLTKQIELLKSFFKKELRDMEQELVKKDLQSLTTDTKQLKKGFELFEKEERVSLEISAGKNEKFNKEITKLKKQSELFKQELNNMKQQIQIKD